MILCDKMSINEKTPSKTGSLRLIIFRRSKLDFDVSESERLFEDVYVEGS